ncbi:MAG: sulfatase [Planctomycetota bacterium]
MPQGYNILHITVHDLGRHLGCYGARVASPNLDRLAREGLRFDRAYCNSVACSPSRMCAMSGRYAHVSGGIGLAHMGWPLDPAVQTVVDVFNQTGHETAHFGHEHERHPRQMRYRVEGNRHWDDSWTECAVDDAIAYLRSRPAHQRFYCNVGTQEVHACRFTVDAIVEGSGPGQYGGRTPAPEVYIPNYVPDTAENRRTLGGFQSSIRYMDHHVGRLLAALDASPFADNTMVLFTTDHGIVSDARRDKGTLWERGTGISLLVRPPRGLRRGQAVPHLVQNIDFLPTFCDAAGIPVPDDCQGRSFWPLCTGAAYRPHEAVFTERNFHGEKPTPDQEHYTDLFDPLRGVHTRRFHYIRAYEPGVKPEPQVWLCREHDGCRPTEYLYDCLQDSMELVNLARRPEYAPVLEDLRGRLQDWMQRSDDFLLRGEVPTPPQPVGWGDWPAQEERTPWRPD